MLTEVQFVLSNYMYVYFILKINKSDSYIAVVSFC